jgi:hypothetical protein
MSKPRLFPRRTAGLIAFLTLFIFILGYFKLSVKPSIDSFETCLAQKDSTVQEIFPPVCVTKNGNRFTQSLTPTPNLLPTIISPSPTPVVQPATPSALIITPTPNPVPTNPQTGRAIYKNTQYGFTFEYPPEWKLSEFSSPPQPIVLVGNGQDQDLTAFTVTLKSWPFDDSLTQTSSPSAWNYSGWQGLQTTTSQRTAKLTFVSAVKTAPGGQVFRATWLRSLDQSNPNTIENSLKPILNSFKFSPLPKTTPNP